MLVQLVEIPGLIEGAADERGGGRAPLGVLGNADAILRCHACDRPSSARFAAQQVGRLHQLHGGDTVEVLARC